MNHTFSEQVIQYHGKKNAFLFWLRSLRRFLVFAFHSTWSIGLASFSATRLMPGHSLLIWSTGLFLILSLIIWKIIHILLLRQAQFYSISNDRITSCGGFLVSYYNEIRSRDIRSVQYTQSLFQRLLGAGTVIISTSASHNDMIILADINSPQEILQMINTSKW